MLLYLHLSWFSATFSATNLNPNFSMCVFCFLLQFVGPQFHFPTFAVCCNLFNPRLFKKVSKNNRFPKITDFKKQQISFKKQLLILKNNRFQRTADFKKQQISKICTAKFSDRNIGHSAKTSISSNIRWNPWRILYEIHGHLIIEEFQQKSNIRIPWPSNSWRIPTKI